MNQKFTAWELETIFHLVSNAADRSSSPFFERYRELAGKAANLRAREYPDYLKQFGQEIEI